MDKDYRAKPELWEAAEKFGRNSMDMSNLVLELRARVEALEAAQRPVVNESVTTAPAGSLVERVEYVDARAAIRQAVAWLRKQGRGNAACELEQEVGQ